VSPTGVIILREVRSYARQRRTMVVLIFLSAALANAGHAIVAVSPLVHLALVTRHAAAVNLSGHRALAQSALVWIGLLPVLFSAQQAAITLAAERERRSLTALLVAPVALGSILLGKLVGSLAPGLLMLGVAYAVYLPSVAHAAPDAASWLPIPIVLAVLFLLLALSTLMNSVALIISALAPTVAGASITATFVLLPVSFAVAALSVKVGDIGPGGIMGIALGAAMAAILVLATASRRLQRAHLLAV
jgi:ABC-type Na+ efflux pump permease subunit